MGMKESAIKCSVGYAGEQQKHFEVYGNGLNH